MVVCSFATYLLICCFTDLVSLICFVLAYGLGYFCLPFDCVVLILDFVYCLCLVCFDLICYLALYNSNDFYRFRFSFMIIIRAFGF